MTPGLELLPSTSCGYFDRFYRAAPVGSSQTGGSGLGLSLAKWIADLHDTELIVESEPGRGSSFSFWLKKAVSRSFMHPGLEQLARRLLMRADSRQDITSSKCWGEGLRSRLRIQIDGW